MSSGGGAAAGGIFGAMGSLMEADDKSKAYDRQADELQANAALNLKIGEFNANRQQMIANKKIGAISADYAASGVASDSGSVLDVLASSHANSELDRLSILHGAQVRSTMMQNRAQVDREAASRSKQMGYFNAFGALFGGAAKAGMDSPSSNSGGGGGGGGSAGGSYGSSGYGGGDEAYV